MDDGRHGLVAAALGRRVRANAAQVTGHLDVGVSGGPGALAQGDLLGRGEWRGRDDMEIRFRRRWRTIAYRRGQ